MNDEANGHEFSLSQLAVGAFSYIRCYQYHILLKVRRRVRQRYWYL